MTRHHLIIDADDTLWENNVYFEEAFDGFIDFLDHSTMGPDEIRTILDEIELANIKVRGYGAQNFALNLCECYQHLVEREIQPGDLDHLMTLAGRIMSQPIEIIDGVPETLEYLSARHDLTLFTKGHPEEQKLKIDRSGLGVWFGHTAIVREKDAASYARLVAEQKYDASLTWMIGNSPKSDINPALEAGLNAVFVPHPRTWHLEKTELNQGPGKVITLERFADLARHF
jgi:putative hydrolase of the HAD superfamily